MLMVISQCELQRPAVDDDDAVTDHLACVIYSCYKQKQTLTSRTSHTYVGCGKCGR